MYRNTWQELSVYKQRAVDLLLHTMFTHGHPWFRMCELFIIFQLKICNTHDAYVHIYIFV